MKKYRFYIPTWKTVPTLTIANSIANASGVCMYQVFDLDDTGRDRMFKVQLCWYPIKDYCLHIKEWGDVMINYKNPQSYKIGDTLTLAC